MLRDLWSRPSGRLTGLSQPARWGRLGVTATVLCLALAGCETLFPDEPEPQRVATATTEGQEPNLGDVPSQAPETSSLAARQEAREGLLADRSQARYTDETLTGEGLVGTAPGLTDPSAPAATQAAPSPPPFASIDSQSGAQPASRQSYQLGGSQAAARTAAPATTAAPAAAPSVPQTQAASPPPQPRALPQVQPQSAQSQSAQPQTAQSQSTQPPRAAPAVQQPAQQQAAAIPSPALPPPPSLPPLPPGPPVLLGVIYFNHNSTALSQNDLQVLRQVVALQQQQGGILRVVGHASQRTAQLDPSAHEATNLRLSERRAESVARALRGFGVRSDAVISEGRGDSEQLFHEFMPTGEAGNRRVEIFLQS